MEIDSRTGLVLEGGGMRAIFTVGVLDCFMVINQRYKHRLFTE